MLHENVVISVDRETINRLTGGYRTELGDVPNLVEQGQSILASCPPMAATFEVEVSELVGRRAYGQSARPYHMYKSPTT